MRDRPSLLAWLMRAALAVGKATTLAFSIEPVLHPDRPEFKGKAMRIRALGYFAMWLAVPIGWLMRGRREPYPVVADLALTVPLLLDSGGNNLGIYDSAHVDDAVHFANTAILSTAFGAVVSPRVGSRWEAAALAVGFGATGETVWEVMEYGADKLGFQGMGLTYSDTLDDMAEGLAGALLAGVITWLRWKPQDRAVPSPVVGVLTGDPTAAPSLT